MNIIKAQHVARKAIESLYEGTCTVTEYRKITDPISHLTSFREIVTFTDQPCRLSFESLPAVNQTDSTAVQTQVTKLFISPDVTIKPNSKITVTQAGITREYKASGVPPAHISHQEITLALFDGWT
jgi:hypothetical protein